MVTSVECLICLGCCSAVCWTIQTLQFKLRQLSREGPRGEQWPAVRTPSNRVLGARVRAAQIFPGVAWPNCIDDRGVAAERRLERWSVNKNLGPPRVTGVSARKQSVVTIGGKLIKWEMPCGFLKDLPGKRREEFSCSHHVNTF
jgi:hypothetical protein